MTKTNIVGIVNITKDSFSDGNLFLETNKAVEKAIQLFKEGASIIDLGAQSTHPNSTTITAKEEINRLIPVIKTLEKNNIPISIDTYKNNVINTILKYNIKMINDIKALEEINENTIEKLKKYNNIEIILMHSVNTSTKTSQIQWTPTAFIKKIIAFFDKKLNYLVKKGLNEKRFILDPGMGLFLSEKPEASLSVLKNIHTIKKYFNNKTYISVSRKSFIGSILNNRPIPQRQEGTLAAEIYAFTKGINYIRTHNVKALNDAITITKAIMNSK